MRVAVLMGGPSSEHPISIKTGEQVAQAIGALPVVIGKDCTWRFDGAAPLAVGAAITELKERADVVFVALHGPYGEDGTVQGLLDAIGMPYTGSGVLGSSLAMDKVRTKHVYRDHGMPTPNFLAVDRVSWVRLPPWSRWP